MSKPKEWFIDGSGMAFFECPNMPNSTYVHVIEKSAYDELQQECIYAIGLAAERGAKLKIAVEALELLKKKILA